VLLGPPPERGPDASPPRGTEHTEPDVAVVGRAMPAAVREAPRDLSSSATQNAA
jgi:hypothetical protein